MDSRIQPGHNFPPTTSPVPVCPYCTLDHQESSATQSLCTQDAKSQILSPTMMTPAPTTPASINTFSSPSSPDHSISSKQQFVQFEDLFAHIGAFGRYQIIVGFCVQYSCLMLAGNFYMMTFGTLRPTWHCDLYPNGTEPTDHCQFLDNCSSPNGTNFLRADGDFYSIVQHWRLTCQKDYIPSLMISIQMLGQALGNPVGGHLADYFGRKWVAVSGFLCFLGSGLLCSIAPSWRVLTVFMFTLGLSFGFYIAAMFVLVMELTGKRYRLIMNLCFQWCIAFQVVALVAYLTRDWRIYMVTINSLCVPLAIVMVLFLEESPRWLIQKQKFDRATSVLNKIARWNAKKDRIQMDCLKTIQLDHHQSTYSFLLLFSTKKLFLYSSICIVTVFFCACVIGVILFNVGSLVGSPFLNVALYGLLRVWVPPFLVLLEFKSSFFGRRPMYLGSMAFVVLCFLGIILITALNPGMYAWHTVATALALAGSCINAGVLDTAITQYAAELFPTVLRAIAFGSFNVADNLGSVVAPQLLYLQKYLEPLPYVAVAGIGVLAWLLAFFVLPETAGKPLPDTLADTKNSKRIEATGVQ